MTQNQLTSVAQLAKELGIPSNKLWQWAYRYGMVEAPKVCKGRRELYDEAAVDRVKAQVQKLLEN